MSMIVGIFLNHDGVSNLAYALKSAGFDSRNLTVISQNEPIGYLRSTQATFVRKAAEPYQASEEPPARIFGDVAWQVPGDETIEPPRDYYSAPELEALSELRVPDGLTDRYVTAIDAGDWVAGFDAGENAKAVEQLFSNAQAKSVAVF